MLFLLLLLLLLLRASGDEDSDAAGDVATSARLTESCICAICKRTRAASDTQMWQTFG